MNKYVILAAVAVGGYLLLGNNDAQAAPGSTGELTREQMIDSLAIHHNWAITYPAAKNDMIARFSDYDVLQVYEADINGNFISGSKENYLAMLRTYGWY